MEAHSARRLPRQQVCPHETCVLTWLRQAERIYYKQVNLFLEMRAVKSKVFTREEPVSGERNARSNSM